LPGGGKGRKGLSGRGTTSITIAAISRTIRKETSFLQIEDGLKKERKMGCGDLRIHETAAAKGKGRPHSPDWGFEGE